MTRYPKILLAIVFALGCLASQVVRDVAIPRPAQAQTAGGGAAPVGAKWQYACIEGGMDAEDATSTFNQWGELGWELATNWGYRATTVFCFKQPL